MMFVNDPRHESAQQSPLPTVDHVEAFGHGTLQHKDTGAGLVERSMQVEITNPGMRSQQGPAVREEAQRLTARSVDVMVRSGNQRPGEVDGRVPDGFIWGQLGEGDPVAAPQPFLTPTAMLLLAGVGLGAYLLFKK
jgi:hypothetical protein